MNKIIVSALLTVVALGASVASAQSYYPTYSPSLYGSVSSSGCVNLSYDLSYGSRGSAVTSLQTFLVAQNYPGGGNWMITGNFKSATQQAVRDFQQTQGLSMTGIADAATRAAIARVSCGYSTNMFNNNNYYTPTSVPTTYNQNPYNYNYNYSNTNTYVNPNNCYYTYPYTCNGSTNYNYNTYGTVVLTTLSPASGGPGTSVTIYGSGFDNSNIIYFGATTLSAVSSYNGTSLTFTVPALYAVGNVNVSVSNSHGTSNMLTFNVTSNTYTNCYPTPYSCGTGYPYPTPAPYPTPYPTPCNYNNGYGYNYCPPTPGQIQLNYLNPNSGAVGQNIVVFGSGFSSTGNTVHFGSGIITNILSTDGTSLSFNVPSQLVGFGTQPLVIGTYNVSVTNSYGATSNAVPFTVTSLGSIGAPTITSVTGPTTLNTGVQATWSVMINNPGGSYVTTSVSWGDTNGGYVNMAAPQTTYTTGASTLTFTHAFISSGTYTVVFTVSNAAGQQNTSSMTVVVSGSSTGGVTLSMLSPTSGHIGTQIMLTGAGFTGDNTVHFGVGGTMHIPSQSGMYLYFTVPSYMNACDVVEPHCPGALQPVTLGSYPIYVSNGNGTSQTISFQVN